MHVHRSSSEAFRWMVTADCPMNYGQKLYYERDGSNIGTWDVNFAGPVKEAPNRHILVCCSAMASSGGTAATSMNATVNGQSMTKLTQNAFSSTVIAWFHAFLPAGTALSFSFVSNGSCSNWGIVGFTMFMKGTTFPVVDTAVTGIAGTTNATTGSLQLNTADRGGAFVAVQMRDAEQGFDWRQPTNQAGFTEIHRVDTRSNEWLTVFSGLNTIATRSTFTIDINYIRNGGVMAAVSWQDPCYTAVKTDQKFTIPGTTSWTVPAGVTSVSAVAVGGGGGGSGTFQSQGMWGSGGAGGALSYVNNLAVTPGETLTIITGEGGAGGAPNSNGNMGGISEIKRGSTILLRAMPGQGGIYLSMSNGGSWNNGVGTARFSGGNGSPATVNHGAMGRAGGAAGYAGAGGSPYTAASGGAGGASGPSGGGGGVGIYGQGATGTDETTIYVGGGGGSQGSDGGSSANSFDGGSGGVYGGGGGGAGHRDDSTAAGSGGRGGDGAVYIIWGAGKSFPNNVL